MASFTRENTIVLFDVDGTLTKPRNVITEEMKVLLQHLKKKVSIAVVGGSDLSKISEQLGSSATFDYDYVFAENGLVYYQNGSLQQKGSIIQELGESNLKRLINYTLKYIADLDVPKKRGTFIEFRNGMINVSPIGRNCTQLEREEFYKWDQETKTREKMVADYQRNFSDLSLTFSIGGQISIDIFPRGWDKTYCLRFIDREKFQNIFFFGDKTMKGGNDYEIYNDSRVIGQAVTGPENTITLLREKFDLKF